MAYLCHLHFRTPISFCTPAKTPISLFSFHSTFPFSNSTLSSPLSLPKFTSLPPRSLSRSVPQSNAAEFSASVDDDELPEELIELPEELELELDHQVDYSDDEDVDIVALEQEAKEVALEYSTSLSRILTIGK